MTAPSAPKPRSETRQRTELVGVRVTEDMTTFGASGACPHLLTVWVPDPTKRGPRDRYRPSLVACRVMHDPREEKPLAHIGAGKRWT